MQKIIIVFSVIVYTLSACHNKAVPVITSRTTEPLRPVTAKVDVKPDMETGKIIFTNRCSKCHDLPRADQYTTQRWEGILSSMIPKARLNEEQAIHVTAYLKAQAKK
jgi:hypothetical protein